MPDAGNHLMTALMAVGVAWLFMHADAKSATTRALALALFFTGAAIIARMFTVTLSAAPVLPPWAGLLVLPGAGGFISAFEWTSRLRQTLPAGHLRTRFGDNAIRIAQGLVVIYALAAITFPDLWIREFLPAADQRASWRPAILWLFVAPLGAAMVLWAESLLLCLNRKPDPAERVRLIAVLIACPLIAAGLVLPVVMTPLVTTLGFFVLLAGAMRHAQLNGRQGQFMSRFLSPQVAALVNRRGLRGAMQERVQTLSVVCCDLRGFTAFAANTGSDAVLQLLREYYDAVGDAVLEVEGTIKDYAGDGVLVLVGAPLAVPDHAQRAVRLANAIRERVALITARWSRPDNALGFGIGVASGSVTVGIVGGEGRLEYAAVGRPVNLAARLCDQAASGAILVARDTIDLLGENHSQMAIEARPPLLLKGFAEPVDHVLLLAGT